MMTGQNPKIYSSRKKHYASIIMRSFLMLLLLSTSSLKAYKLLIPMDLTQSDHLKSYGIAFWVIKEKGTNVQWLLNYRGGSFLMPFKPSIKKECQLRGVDFESVNPSEESQILSEIQKNNMEVVLLEKAPKMAVYTPKEKKPWDDAVTLALAYAEIPYKKLFDKEILQGKLKDYDWIHLHHEDFSGQFSKFYRSFKTADWYIKQKYEAEKLTKALGFNKVSEEKRAVAFALMEFVKAGGFLFAMCAATNTLDLALASLHTDIVDIPFDGDGVDPNYKSKLDYSQCFAFKNFDVDVNPISSIHDNIDVNHVNSPLRKEALDFTLFDFSAKYDPVPTMLVQNHVNFIKGFYGLTTSFNKAVIKKSVLILGEVEQTPRARYIHGNLGRGQFTFFGGHDPEDYAHQVGEGPTELTLHKNSPGYRLILNNILFPAAKKKEQKT